MSETPKTYTVSVTLDYQAESPDDAVLQAAGTLDDRAYKMGYRVEDENGFVGFYDAEDVLARLRMEHDPLTIRPPVTPEDNDPEGVYHWSVSGDLREIRDERDASTNYAVASKLQELDRFKQVTFDPEYSCFFAYCDTEGDALWVKQFALDIARGNR